jgi:hypothetical protein
MTFPKSWPGWVLERPRVHPKLAGLAHNGDNYKDRTLPFVQHFTDARINLRAIKSKRFADAFARTPQAKQEYIDKTTPNITLSVLHFTDSILLFLYSFWCSEQVSGRPRPAEYSSSDALRASVLSMWEREHRRDDVSTEEKERIGCMVGLMYVCPCLISY